MLTRQIKINVITLTCRIVSAAFFGENLICVIASSTGNFLIYEKTNFFMPMPTIGYLIAESLIFDDKMYFNTIDHVAL